MRCRYMDFFFFMLCFFAVILPATGQNIELRYTEFKENRVILHYDLRDSIAGRFFTIRLYSSKDSHLNPLEKVSGDVGLEVRPGMDKKIIWDAQQELGSSFEGKVSLEIRGRVFIPFINTESIDRYKVYKRKRKYNLTWTGGTHQNILNFDLYRREKKIISYSNLANVGSYALEFPGYVKPGKKYRFRISDTKNREDVVYTEPFEIKRKVPLLLKAIPVLAAGFVIYWLVKPGDPGESDIGDARTPG